MSAVHAIARAESSHDTPFIDGVVLKTECESVNLTIASCTHWYMNRLGQDPVRGHDTP